MGILDAYQLVPPQPQRSDHLINLFLSLRSTWLFYPHQTFTWQSVISSTNKMKFSIFAALALSSLAVDAAPVNAGGNSDLAARNAALEVRGDYDILNKHSAKKSGNDDDEDEDDRMNPDWKKNGEVENYGQKHNRNGMNHAIGKGKHDDKMEDNNSGHKYDDKKDEKKNNNNNGGGKYDDKKDENNKNNNNNNGGKYDDKKDENNKNNNNNNNDNGGKYDDKKDENNKNNNNGGKYNDNHEDSKHGKLQ